MDRYLGIPDFRALRNNGSRICVKTVSVHSLIRAVPSSSISQLRSLSTQPVFVRLAEILHQNNAFSSGAFRDIIRRHCEKTLGKSSKSKLETKPPQRLSP
jgi:hypothetical protein